MDAYWVIKSFCEILFATQSLSYQYAQQLPTFSVVMVRQGTGKVPASQYFADSLSKAGLPATHGREMNHSY
jgi:hypothetical protein